MDYSNSKHTCDHYNAATRDKYLVPFPTTSTLRSEGQREFPTDRYCRSKLMTEGLQLSTKNQLSTTEDIIDSRQEKVDTGTTAQRNLDPWLISRSDGPNHQGQFPSFKFFASVFWWFLAVKVGPNSMKKLFWFCTTNISIERLSEIISLISRHV